jgi:hypothetical protein
LHSLVDGVDVVDSLALGAVALRHGIDAHNTGLSFGRGLFAFADLDRRGPGLFIAARAVRRTAAQVVEVAFGRNCQSLELALAVDLELALEDMPSGRAAEPFVRLIDPTSRAMSNRV